MAKSASGVQFVNVPAEDLPEIALKHQVDAVPTVIIFKNNAAIDRIDGVDIANLTSKVKKLSGAGDNGGSSLEDRLKALINKAKIMIFMKGDRDAPRCGFSKQLIAIINEAG